MSVLVTLLARSQLTADVHLPTLPAVLVIAGLAAGTVFVALHVLRLRRARQMERVRTQIASDLHDDVGSALTRLGVQSELIAATDDPARMKALAVEIGHGAREIIATIKERAAHHDLNRGLSLSLPYFDDQELAMALESFEVIPQGRIMFVPAFVVRAARAQQAKVADDTRLSPGTRRHLIHEQ